jgi:hypothetical protein
MLAEARAWSGIAGVLRGFSVSYAASHSISHRQNFWEPSHGWVNSTDGGRGHSFQDYQQQ